MINWREVPFLRLFFPFVAGIVFASFGTNLFNDSNYWSLSQHFPLVNSLLIAILTAVLLFSNARRFRFPRRWVFGVLVNIWLILFGMQITVTHHDLSRQDHFSKFIGARNLIVGKVKSIRASERFLRLHLAVDAIGDHTSSSYAASGNLLVYVPVDLRSREIAINGKIGIKCRISEIPRKKNPKAFDFRRFMAIKNTFYQAFIGTEDWAVLSRPSKFAVKRWADGTRNFFLQLLKEHLTTTNEYGVGAALVLGKREAVSNEIRNAYADTGAMHVLAVSGLHVGFVYLGISFLLGRFRSTSRTWQILRTLIVLIAVWSFALITGAAPSVLRAATMFSFIGIGQSLNRSASIYNILAASAFFLLSIDPMTLWEVGFQLSYLAVLGIVYFQPKIYGIWYIENKLGDYLWKLTAVGIAAQITTFPISLFYFHQFPLYFWLSGLVVVPAATLIITTSFLLFVAASVPLISFVLGKLLFLLIWCVNALIFAIRELPFSTLSGIWLDSWLLLPLYLMIVFVVFAIEKRSRRWFAAVALCLLIFALWNVSRSWQAIVQKKIVFYHISKEGAIDFIDGQKVYNIAGNSYDEQKLQMAAQNYRWYSRARFLTSFEFSNVPIERPNLLRVNNLYQFFGTKLRVIDADQLSLNITSSLPLDYVFLRNNPSIDLEELTALHSPKGYIFDTSNSRRKVDHWQRTCLDLGLNCHDLWKDGAFIIQAK